MNFLTEPVVIHYWMWMLTWAAIGASFGLSIGGRRRR